MLYTLVGSCAISPKIAENLLTFCETLDENFTLLILSQGILPYMGYLGMCGSKGYVFLAVLVINRVSILAILVINKVWVLHSALN